MSSVFLVPRSQVDIVAGRKFLQVGSGFLLGAGIAELIAGAIVIADSSGYYIGGVYVGIVAMITGSLGTVLYNRSQLVTFAVLLICTIIVAIVGTAIQASNYDFVKDLEACSSFSSTKTTSCSSTPSSFTCTGNEDYFSQALVCETSYYISYGSESNQCSCVQSENSGTCYSYTNINDCHKLVTVLAGALQASYAFDLICLFIAVILLVIAVISFYAPALIQSNAEREAAATAQSSNVTQAPTVVVTPVIAQAQPVKGNNYV